MKSLNKSSEGDFAWLGVCTCSSLFGNRILFSCVCETWCGKACAWVYCKRASNSARNVGRWYSGRRSLGDGCAKGATCTACRSGLAEAADLAEPELACAAKEPAQSPDTRSNLTNERISTASWQEEVRAEYSRLQPVIQTSIIRFKNPSIYNYNYNV